MEIHKPKWHSGNIKTWHILCFFYPPPPHTLLAVSRRPSPFHPSLSSPGFFNREHICCRNSSEGHVNPPWHSWLSRQTDGQASGLTPLTRGPKGTRIYNWPNLTPRRRNSARTDQQIHGKLTIQDSYFNPQTSRTVQLLHLHFRCWMVWITVSVGAGLIQMLFASF